MADYNKLKVWTRVPVNTGVEGISTPGEPVEVSGRTQIWQLLNGPQPYAYVRIDCYDGAKHPATIWTSNGQEWTKDADAKDADKLVEQFAKDYAEAEAERLAAEAAAGEAEAQALDHHAEQHRKRGRPAK